MVVQTKFNVGDKAWFMLENKPNCVDITGLNISIYESGNVEIEYTLHYDKLKEENLFATKEELLKSL